MQLDYGFVGSNTELQPGDVEGINRLLRQLTALPQELTRQAVESVVETSHLLLVRDRDADNRVVGTACLVLYCTLLRKQGRVEDVVVEQDYRGHGIGRRMVELLLSTAKDLRLEKVELSSNPSRKSANELYRRMGFQQVQTNVYRWNIAH